MLLGAEGQFLGRSRTKQVERVLTKPRTLLPTHSFRLKARGLRQPNPSPASSPPNGVPRSSPRTTTGLRGPRCAHSRRSVTAGLGPGPVRALAPASNDSEKLGCVQGKCPTAGTDTESCTPQDGLVPKSPGGPGTDHHRARNVPPPARTEEGTQAWPPADFKCRNSTASETQK